MPLDDLARAYLRQVAEDLEAAKAVAKQGTVYSTLCMLLQMAFEKITKAALLEGDHWPRSKAENTHKVLKAGSRLLENLQRHSKVLGLHHNWDYLRQKLGELEDRHPQLYEQRSRASEGGDAFARHGQLEYPWWEGDDVRWPARDLNLAKELRDPKSRWGIQLLRLADELVWNFDDIFG
jgi:hypothetical protein